MEVSEGDEVFVRGGADFDATAGLICLGVAIDVSETEVLVRYEAIDNFPFLTIVAKAFCNCLFPSRRFHCKVMQSHG